MLFGSSTRTSSSSAFPDPRGDRSRHFNKSTCPLTAVMAVASTMTLESRAEVDLQLPQLRNNKSLNVYLEGFLRCRAVLVVIHAIYSFGCHAMLKAFKQTSNLCSSSHPSSQSTWIAGKFYCTSFPFTIALHHRFCTRGPDPFMTDVVF